MKAVHARAKHASAKREMAAFDALPPEIRDFLRTANLNWTSSTLNRRLKAAGARKGGRWGADRLMQQYYAEDAIPADINP